MEKNNGYIERKIGKYMTHIIDEVNGMEYCVIDFIPSSAQSKIKEIFNMRVIDDTDIKDFENFDCAVQDDTYNQISYSIKLGCVVFCGGSYSVEANYSSVKEMYQSLISPENVNGFITYWSVDEIAENLYIPYLEIKITEPNNEPYNQYDTLEEKYL